MRNILIDIKEWEKAFETLPKVQRLTNPDVFNQFCSFLKLHWYEGLESLHYSPGYYYFTGRKGVWLYWGIDSVCVVCWHPNRLGHLLIYPQIGNPKYDLLNEILDHLPYPPVNLQIARVLDDSSIPHIQTERVKSSKLIAEPVLDWTYPVRILSTEKATESSGPDLHHTRKEARKLASDDIEFRPYTGKELPALYRVGQKYAHQFLLQNPDFALSCADIVTSNNDMLILCMERPDIFKSMVTFYQGTPEGLFVWEERSEKTANALWFLYNREIRGLSYKQMHMACDMLKNRGIKLCNFGGSETQGMDFFKTRFRPVQSFELKSLFLELMSEEISEKGRLKVYG